VPRMKRSSVCGTFVLSLFLFTAGIAKQESRLLLPNVKVGDKFVYDFKASYAAGGRTFDVTAKIEMTVLSLDPKGTITFRNDQRDMEARSGETVSKRPDSMSTTRFKLNGVLLSTDPPHANSEIARFSRLMQIVVPEDKASVGRTWTWKVAPAESNGHVGVEGDGELLAFEERGGTPCAKVRISARETAGEPRASGKMDVWISLRDGLPFEMAVAFENIPFAKGVTGSYKGVNVRKASSHSRVAVSVP
jgi:hypothetical protein